MKKFIPIFLLLSGCAACPPGIAANAENVRLIVADNRALVAESARSANEKADIELHNSRAETLAKAMAEACR